MISCEGCLDWFHPKCVGLETSKAKSKKVRNKSWLKINHYVLFIGVSSIFSRLVRTLNSGAVSVRDVYGEHNRSTFSSYAQTKKIFLSQMFFCPSCVENGADKIADKGLTDKDCADLLALLRKLMVNDAPCFFSLLLF